MEVTFEIEKLNKKDRTIYEKMTDAEKQSFEKTWTQIEILKLKQIQQKNASKEREAKEKRVLAERLRKERNHRLIERGAILEAYIKDPLDFSNDEIKEIVAKTMNTDFMKRYIEDVRNRDRSEMKAVNNGIEGFWDFQ